MYRLRLLGGTVLRDTNQATWLPGIANSGPIQSTIRRFDNFGEAIVRGIDLDVSSNIKLGALGKLKLAGQATYLTKSAASQTRGGPIVSGLGNFFGFETPRVRATASATWDYREVSFLARYNFTSKWFFGDPVSGCFASAATVAAIGGKCEVDSFATIDAGLTYTGVKAVTATLLVRNITSRDAPYDPNQTTLGFNPTFHSPQGTNFVLTVAYRFK